MRKLMLVLAVVALGACSGSGLNSEDQAKSDDLWESFNELEREAFCDEMDSSTARVTAADDIQAELAEADDPSIGEEDPLGDFADLVEKQDEYEARAVAIVEYMHGKC